MTKQEQQFLIAFLNLARKLKVNDATVMDDVTVINNYGELTNDDKKNIEEIITNETYEATLSNKDLLKAVINSIKHVDKEYLLESLEFQTFDKSSMSEEFKAYVNGLLDKTITCRDSKNQYTLYMRIANSCILSRDSDLIIKAIDKINEINTVSQ